MKIFSKKSFLGLLILLTIVSACWYALAEEGKETQQFVAKVNGTEISGKSFDRSYAAAVQQFANIGWNESNSEQMADLKNKVLDRLINLELLYQQSEKKEIAIDDKVIEEQYAMFVKQFDQKEDFLDFLGKNNFTEEEFKQDFKKKMRISKLQKALYAEFNESVVVTDNDAREFYEKNIDGFKIPERIRASHILISVEKDADAATREEARAKIEEIQKQIKEGKDFAELAKTYSSCPSGKEGGDLGFWSRGQMVPPFDDAAFKLQPGEVSDIVETEYGYHLIKLTDRNEGGTLNFEDVKARIKDGLRQQKIDSKFEQYMETVRSNAKIERNLPAVQ